MKALVKRYAEPGLWMEEVPMPKVGVNAVIQSLSHVRLFVTPQTAAHQASQSFTMSQSLLRLMFIELVMLSIHLILCHPFSFCLQSFPGSGSFPLNRLFTSGGQSIGASASASVLAVNIQCWFPLGLTGWSPCSPRDSQEPSPTPQFESINSLVLSLLYDATFITVHDY